MKKYVAYYRVSTKKQGLGLEAQQAIVHNYCQNEGSVIIAEYSEKESGKETSHRQELANALKRCKEEHCYLIAAKLDRLSRDVADTFHMFRKLENHVIVCNQDVSDTLTLGIFASLAQKERELISKRTKEALSALKAKGVVLGNPKTKGRTAEAMMQMREMAKRSAIARRKNADDSDANRKAYAVISGMSGTLKQKAEKLNEFGFMAPRGGSWSAMQVLRVLKRYSA